MFRLRTVKFLYLQIVSYMMANATCIYKEYKKISYRNEIVLALFFFHKHQNKINDYNI